MTKWLLLVPVLLLAAPADANISKGVQRKLSGKILLTDKPLPPTEGKDGAIVKKYKALHKNKLTHVDGDQGVPVWNFHYTAFLKRAPKSTSLSIDFFTADKEKLYVASKRLINVDPKLRVLSGSISISEDDNLNKKRTYDVKITVQVGKKHVTLASTRVSTE